ncbi:MAG: DEAD/DEAH box helicase [Hyphomicrobiales bacterium]
MMFDSLGLSRKVLEAVGDAGFKEPTPIQARAIPAALERRDVLGLAQTGSGKTAAFVWPILSLLEKGRARARMPRALILEPTRELAVQVHDAFSTFATNSKTTIVQLIGGVSFSRQDRILDRGADVVIATPGRLLDHAENGKLMLHGVELFVVDEADRMMDMGFIPDLEKIHRLLPRTRQTLFFSATMPPEIETLSDTFLRRPVTVKVAAPATTASGIAQHCVFAPSPAPDKRRSLRRLIGEQGKIPNAIIFANRKATVRILERSLRKHDLNCAALHGDMDQNSRLDTLERFRNGEVTFLIASDVAARGLDIPAVSHVFNFDVPTHAEDYVHRIGRTGRAGREGFSCTLVTTEEMKYLEAIKTLIKRDIAWLSPPPDENARSQTSDKTTSPANSSRKTRTPRANDLRGKSASAATKTGNEKMDRATVPKTSPAPKKTKTGKPSRDQTANAVPDATAFANLPPEQVPAFLLRSVG